MKREILFRGKRIDNGKWVEGFYVLRPDGNHLIYWKPFEEASQNTYHIVDPNTVGQFTGLTDKNGVKIFDGDIFIDDMCHGDFINDRFLVRFEDGKFCYANYGTLSDLCDCVDSIEVIGNVHD